jgi:hypothetical protein
MKIPPFCVLNRKTTVCTDRQGGYKKPQERAGGLPAHCGVSFMLSLRLINQSQKHHKRRRALI